MGSTIRKNNPAPTPFGFGTYNGKDDANPNAAFPKGLMPDTYQGQPQQFNSSGGSGFYEFFNKVGNMQTGQQGGSDFGKINALSKDSPYSPFFMRF